MNDIIGACYGNSKEKQIEMVTNGFDYFAILQYQDIQMLEGKLLTFIEATNTDKEQREAQKSLIRGMVWEWSHNLFLRNWNKESNVPISNPVKRGKSK